MAYSVGRSLLGVCRRHVREDRGDATVCEPYIPYIPRKWNRCLVLAEAQNHGRTSCKYLSWLKQLDSTRRMQRLYLWDDGLGCQPWDDGSLKLAVAAAFGSDPEQWAVSNAVLWSRVDKLGQHARPSEQTVQWSVQVWRELFPVLRPDLVVTAGAFARTVVDGAQDQEAPLFQRLALMLPSPSYLSRVSGLFDEKDILRRFPEVKDAIAKRPEMISDGRYTKNKIFFACHVVSSAKQLRLKNKTATVEAWRPREGSL